MTLTPPILLDCTRSVARRLAGHQPSGIDRVCDAYSTHFASRARAVVQLRGKARVLSSTHSRRLLALLAAPVEGFRRSFGRFAPAAYAAGQTRFAGEGAVYLNVSHTDFDLQAHHRWVQRCGLRSVYLLHDLIPIMHPQWTTPHRVERHHGRVLAALRSATGIIVNSQNTALLLEQFAHEHEIASPPVLSAPLAAADLSFNVSTDVDQAAFDPLPETPYFVCVSTIEARKNHMLLLKVWRRLIAAHGAASPRLLIVGKWGIHSARVRRYFADHPELSGYVTIKNRCSDSEVACALAGAQALLAPSRAEGFGLPVAEALKLGVPVIASNLPAFREIGADLPLFLDPLDEAGWLFAIRAFSQDNELRRAQLKNLKHYKAPSWQDHFALVDSWLDRLPSILQVSAAGACGIGCVEKSSPRPAPAARAA